MRALLNELVRFIESELTTTDQMREVDKLIEDINAGKRTVMQLVEIVLKRHETTKRLLIVGDQFEELYTHSADVAVQQAFLSQLFGVIEGMNGRCCVLLSLRADFFKQMLNYAPLAASLNKYKPLVLGAMSQEDLLEAIIAPSQNRFVFFEPKLIGQIVDDLGNEPGNLPLLQFALTQLWERQVEQLMTSKAYAEIGDVERALTKHADARFNALSEAEKLQAERLFIQMVHFGEGTEDTRRQAVRNELIHSWGLVQKLANEENRLIITGRNAKDEETAELVHEALIIHWVRFAGWIDLARDFRRWQDRLRFRMEDWSPQTHDKGALLRGSDLLQAEEMLDEREEEIAEEERDFIEASLIERKRGERSRQIVTVGAVVAALLMAILAGFGFIQRNSALRSTENESIARETAVAAQVTSIANAALAQTQEAHAVSSQLDAEKNAEEAQLQATRAANSESIALTREAEAVIFAQNAQSRALASSSQSVGDQNGMLSYLLAIQAQKSSDTSQAFAALDQRDHLIAVSVHTFEHEGKILDMAWNKDSTQILTRSEDGTVIVWDAEADYAPLFQLHHAGVVRGASWNNDETQILTYSEDGTAEVWDASDGTLIFSLEHGAEINFADWDELQAKILTRGGSTVRMWNALNGDLIFELNNEVAIDRLKWLELQNLIVTGGNSGARIWDQSDGKLIQLLPFSDFFVSDIYFDKRNSIVWFELRYPPSLSEPFRFYDFVQLSGWDVINNKSTPPIRIDLEGLDIFVVQQFNDVTGKSLIFNTALFGSKPENNLDYVSFAIDLPTIVSQTGSGEIGTPLPFEHGAPLSTAIWNEDGTRVLTTGRTHLDITLIPTLDRVYAKNFDAQTGELTHKFEHNSSSVSAFWTKYESRLLTSDSNGVFKIWDTESGILLHSFTRSDTGTLIQENDGFFWNQDETRLLAVGDNGFANLWDTVSGELIITFPQEVIIEDAKWNNDETLLLLRDENGTVKLWKTDQIETIPTIFHDGGRSPRENPNDSIVMTYSNGKMRFWESDTGNLLFEFGDDVGFARWRSDGQQIITLHRDDFFRVWKFPEMVLLHQIPYESDSEYFQLDWNEDLSLLWIGYNLIPDEFVFLNTDTGELVQRFDPDTNVQWMKNKTQILATSGEVATIWDAAEAWLLHTFAHDDTIIVAQLNKDETQLLIVGEDGMAKLWRIEDDSLINEFQFQHDDVINDVLWSPDEIKILTNSKDETIKVWDAHDGRLISTFTHSGIAGQVKWSLDSQFVVSREGISAYAWKIGEDEEPVFGVNFEDTVYDVKWNSTGTQILVTSADGSTKVVDFPSGNVAFNLVQNGSVSEAEWNSDETQILTVSRDGYARVWDAKTGLLMFELGDGTEIRDAYWNDDESRIIVTTVAGRFYTYLMNPEERIARACERATRNLTWLEWQQYVPGQPYQKTCENLSIHESVPIE